MLLDEKALIFPTRKTLALLIYLAIEARLQPREHLAALLWPDASSERSHASLRNTLGHLQMALTRAGGQAETPYLLISHTALGLNPDASIKIDTNIIEAAYAKARLDRSSRSQPEGSDSLPLLQSAAACQRGDFLVGFSLGDAPVFDDWAAVQREVWHRRLGLIFDRMSEIQFAGGDFAGAAETASRWIALDALNEVAYRRKMRAHYAAGERGQALSAYEVCRAILIEELGVEPEPDTEVLAARIRTQLSVHPAAPEHILADTSVSFLGNLFAGRKSEYQVLVDSYEHAASGLAQLVVLRGEAGIGKTRLATKFLAWVSAQGSEILKGSAFESSSHLPFQALVEALRLWLGEKNTITESLDDDWRSSLGQLLPLLKEGNPGYAETEWDSSAPEAKDIRSQLFESFLQFTLELTQQAPLVLFVDDLQWADSATLDLLQYFIRRWRESAVRVLLLVSLRSEALIPINQSQGTGARAGSPLSLIEWLRRVGRELAPIYLELEPLGEQETVQMAKTILSPPAADFAQWLYAETHGHPFYLVETLKDLLERRVLHPKRKAQGQWTFAVDAEHNLGQAVRVPSNVHAVIRSRLNRLSPNAFSLLTGAAVLERRITFVRLCAISTLDEDLALPALDELISFRLLLEAAQPGAASDYTFINDMLRDVVYTEAGDARRRLFHKRALEMLETSGDSPAVLAHHALAAGLMQSAFRFSLAAGREALRLMATNEAIVHFERANRIVLEGSLPEAAAEFGFARTFSAVRPGLCNRGTERRNLIDVRFDLQ